jgi:hypothetical protein
MRIKIMTVAFAAVLGLGVIGFASAQESSTTKQTTHNSTRALTGCLQMGDDEYVLLADDGGIWELQGNRVKLDGQIGHTVTITGVVLDPAMHAAKGNTRGEMKEHGGFGYMTVSKLTLVSSSCERSS